MQDKIKIVLTDRRVVCRVEELSEVINNFGENTFY